MKFRPKMFSEVRLFQIQTMFALTRPINVLESLKVLTR